MARRRMRPDASAIRRVAAAPLRHRPHVLHCCRACGRGIPAAANSAPQRGKTARPARPGLPPAQPVRMFSHGEEAEGGQPKSLLMADFGR